MMKYFQAAFHHLGQNWTYVTYDEAIYSKAQQIKWRNQREFEDDYFELGGFHRASEEITSFLLNLQACGETALTSFINERLNGQKEFMDPISKPKFNSFSALNKKVKPKQQQSLKFVNIDREIFSRLVVTCSSSIVPPRWSNEKE